MEEKIKVNISKSIHELLKNDAELFEFRKKTGSLNMNRFYNLLITNYYEKFHENQTKMIELTKKELSNQNITERDADYLSSRIIDKLESLTLYDKSDKFNVSISIRPTASSAKIFDYINNYLMTDKTISSFYRILFSSYARNPRNIREQIIFKDTYETILKAIDENKQIYFKYSSGAIKTDISPYAIANAKEELFNYLLCVENKRHSTYRLSRVMNAGIVNKSRTITDKQKKILEKMIILGPQYRIKGVEDEEIIIQLTDSGIEMFDKVYLHRPRPVKIEENLYYFNCTIAQADQYFRKFGRAAYVISPLILREILKNFYKNGYHRYNQ